MWWVSRLMITLRLLLLMSMVSEGGGNDYSKVAHVVCVGSECGGSVG